LHQAFDDEMNAADCHGTAPLYHAP
jgi:hypothetical protein